MKQDAYFNEYCSNTLAGSSNQHYYERKSEEPFSARSFYKIARGGRFCYSLLFSDIISSPFRRLTAPGTVIDGWRIEEARVGKCRRLGADGEMENAVMDKDIRIEWLSKLSFGGKAGYEPRGGEVFYSDGVELEFQKGEFLALELTVSGKRFPCHPESQLAVYSNEGGEWKYSPMIPIAEAVGVKGEAPLGRIGFLGDSITQGCGAGHNTYAHWNARLAELLGDGYSYHNLGIGYGMAAGAATDGIWLKKAKNNDTVFLCFGVNDINAGHPAPVVLADLTRVVELLTEAGCRIILQTVPPFGYPPEKRAEWERLNEAIKAELSERVALVFDCVPLLSESKDEPHIPKYGGHPNAEGCEIWASALYEAVKHLF